jgi:Reverse transcriptase (RNA-dependent DNA polymerase)
VQGVREKARAYFAPNQFGVAVPMGAESCIHAWREAISDPSLVAEGLVALKVDLQNAFNNVDRKAMLALVHSKFPELYSFVHYCYSRPSHLFVRGSRVSIPSSQGAQQGDPLGPLLSCLVFHEVVQRINLIDDVRLNSWYMDDGGIIASPTAILKVLSVFDEVKSELGMFLNESKTELIWLSGAAPSVNPLSSFKFKLTHVSEMEMLGAPLGNEEFCDHFVLQKVEKNELLIEKLHLLNDPHPHLAFVFKLL